MRRVCDVQQVYVKIIHAPPDEDSSLVEVHPMFDLILQTTTEQAQ